jgi:hypothetical protein
MNFDDLSNVKFGDLDGLARMLFENGMQHRLFYDILGDAGIAIPDYPIMEAEPNNLDDWLFVHNQMHEALASILNLENPFQLQDADWNVEEDFYDWVKVHETIHQQIAARLRV